MSGTMGFRSVGLIVAIALAGTVYTARPAHAGGDLGKVLAGAVIGYLVYKALDDDDSGSRHHQRGYKPAPPRRHPGQGVCKKCCQHRWGQKCDHRSQHGWGQKCDNRGGERDWGRYGDRGRDWGRDRDGGRDYDWDRGRDGGGDRGYGWGNGRNQGGRDGRDYGGRGGGGRR